GRRFRERGYEMTSSLIEENVLGDGGHRHVAIVRELLKADLRVNLPDAAGATPLGIAVQKGYANIIRNLELDG
ncbi:MAG TPA: hypothetical protein QF533_09375, partial [Nitrospinota bacterium]|nr:hypothetical protein [Nitrospinota bacterium]